MRIISLFRLQCLQNIVLGYQIYFKYFGIVTKLSSEYGCTRTAAKKTLNICQHFEKDSGGFRLFYFMIFLSLDEITENQ